MFGPLLRSSAGRRRFLVGFVGLLLLTAVGCGGCREQAPLVIAFDDTPNLLDPHLQNHSVAWSVLGNIYDALVRFTPAMELEPALAVAWEEVDSTHWVLSLRPGVRFHDGSALTAADVVGSLSRAMSHPRSLLRHYLVGIVKVEELDDLTVVIVTTGPVPDLLNRLTFLLIVPDAQRAVEEISEPIGTGPYRFVGRRTDGAVELAAWPGWRGVPEIGRVTFTFFETDEAAAETFFSGIADILHMLPDDQLPAVQRDPNLRAEPQPRLAVQMLAVVPGAVSGETGRALADVRVRRALWLALDRSRWTRAVYRGNGTAASQYVHPVVFGYDPALRPEPYDPVRARELLAEAGFAGGFDVTLGHGFVTSGIIEAIIDDLAQVGVRVAPRAEQFGEILNLARQGEVPLIFYAWACSTGDASDFLNSSIHSRDPGTGLGAENYTGYTDQETDSLIELADRESTPEIRRALLQRAQRRALDAALVIPLTTRWAYLGVRSRVDVVTRHDERIWAAAYRWHR